MALHAASAAITVHRVGSCTQTYFLAAAPQRQGNQSVRHCHGGAQIRL